MTGSLLPLGEPMPGASFTELIRSLDLAPEWTLGTDAVPPSFHPPDATTVLALRYDGGVVMVGDRQATAGYDIAHRTSRRSSRQIPIRRLPSRERRASGLS